MPINKGLGGFCFLKSVKDEIKAIQKMSILIYLLERPKSVEFNCKSKFHIYHFATGNLLPSLTLLEK